MVGPVAPENWSLHDVEYNTAAARDFVPACVLLHPNEVMADNLDKGHPLASMAAISKAPMTIAPNIHGGRRASRQLQRCCSVLGVFAIATTLSATTPDEDIAVRVQKHGSEISVEVDCPVRAPTRVVWDVLTDYDHMTRYISNLAYSGVEGRVADVLMVHQTGNATRGPFSFAFDNVRAVELVPFTEIRSRLVSGNLKASQFTTRIVEADDVVHILNSGRYRPEIWVPPLIGPALIEEETRKQYGEIRAEILRRAHAANGLSAR